MVVNKYWLWAQCFRNTVSSLEKDLAYDATSGCVIRLCIKINNTLVYLIFCNIMK